MSQTYECTVPVVWIAYVTVEADSPEEAIMEAVAVASSDDVDEWTAYEHIVRGNVCYVTQNKAEAEEVSA